MRHQLPLLYIEAIAKHGSIRKAAEHLAITPSALNRRLIAMETELEVPLFERLAKGVRLSAAGEIMLDHIRNQISDMERVKSRIADLSGMRRGHVTIGCSPEIHGGVLPGIVGHYRKEFPDVTFAMVSLVRADVEAALIDHSIDLAIVFEPLKLADFQTLFSLNQPIHVRVPKDHPLCGRASLRLYECLEHPFVAPDATSGVRLLLQNASVRLGLNLSPALVSNQQNFLTSFIASGKYLHFDLPINFADNGDCDEFSYVPMDLRDINPGFVFVGHLRGRALPVAAARFTEDVVEALSGLDGN